MSSIAAANKKEKILAILRDAETKGEVKNSVVEGLKTTVAGVAGAFIGGAIGRPSFLLGIGTTMAGHYLGSHKVASFGVGMIATGGANIVDGVKGTPVNGFEGVKERMKAVAQNFKHSLYVDKFTKKKTTTKTDEGTDGLGEVQYFKYPGNELDMGSLNSIEQELLRKTEMEENQMTGSYDDDVKGMEENIY
jgi:hypothetical protein